MIPDPEHKRIHMISLPDIVSSSTGHSDEVILIRAKERKHALQNRTTSFVAQSSRRETAMSRIPFQIFFFGERGAEGLG